MQTPVNLQPSKTDLFLQWAIVGLMLTILASIVAVCHILGESLQHPLAEAQRIVFRTVFYVIAIVTFPLTNLIRHIQLRLNQTMPISDPACSNHDNIVKVAKSRYLITNIISMSLIEVLGVFGLVMFVWGDGFNTLYIFTALATLGLYLYRPKIQEYYKIVEAMTVMKNK